MNLLLLSLAFTSLAFAADKPGIHAGAAAVNITPTQFPMNMPGGFRANMAEKAHHPFHSRALVLDNDW
jgi:neutral ceramidase